MIRRRTQAPAFEDFDLTAKRSISRPQIEEI
jgi:hypothetical protein